ncbi:MAG: ABC transporter ATP-binding protein [Candidatus Rokuibacteriota bacterium]|nr:MAG: ABC transporter ATP-binding protein [Candidatus Rokubacteria bacterium]
MTALALRDIHHDFSGLQVLSGIDLEVEDGERHAIIGPNGAGKSTLFNIITGRLAPRKGHVVYRGRDITGAPPHRIARLGIGRSFQIINTFPRLTVYENVRSAVLSRRRLRLDAWSLLERRSDVARESEDVLAAVGLRDRRDTPASELSYGEQRELEIALTVATRPELILLDEPTAGLNSEDTRRAIGLIRRVTEGKTLVMVEHDMEVVFNLADRISVIYYGRVLATGPPDEIRASDEVKRAYLGRKAGVAGG